MQNNENQTTEAPNTVKSGLDIVIRKIVKKLHKRFFRYFTDETKFVDSQLNELFKVTKSLCYSEEDLNDLEFTIKTMFKEIENDLDRAMQDNGLKIHYQHQYKEMQDIYKVGLVNILLGSDSFFVTPEVIYKIIYDKYKLEYIDKTLHLIEIAKEFKNIITICLYYYMENIVYISV